MSKPRDRGKFKEDDNAVARAKSHGKGRVFYCSLGHKHPIFQDPKLVQFYLDGIQSPREPSFATLQPIRFNGQQDLCPG